VELGAHNSIDRPVYRLIDLFAGCGGMTAGLVATAGSGPLIETLRRYPSDQSSTP
jgi:hypothetical protein